MGYVVVCSRTMGAVNAGLRLEDLRHLHVVPDVGGRARAALRSTGLRSSVSSGSSVTPSSRALLTRCTWCSSTDASAGRWPGSREVARATSASTYAGRSGTSDEGGGTSLWTCL